MQKQNLIALIYAQNHCYTRVVDIDAVPEVELDIEKEAWSWENYRNIKIGDKRSLYLNGFPNREGIIGVYDKSETKQLDAMVSHSREATDELVGMLDE